MTPQYHVAVDVENWFYDECPAGHSGDMRVLQDTIGDPGPGWNFTDIDPEY